jgi:hypothetical protein
MFVLPVVLGCLTQPDRYAAMRGTYATTQLKTLDNGKLKAELKDPRRDRLQLTESFRSVHQALPRGR